MTRGSKKYALNKKYALKYGRWGIRKNVSRVERPTAMAKERPQSVILDIFFSSLLLAFFLGSCNRSLVVQVACWDKQGRRKQFWSGTAIGYLCVRTQLHMYAGVSSVQLSCRNTFPLLNQEVWKERLTIEQYSDWIYALGSCKFQGLIRLFWVEDPDIQ